MLMTYSKAIRQHKLSKSKSGHYARTTEGKEWDPMKGRPPYVGYTRVQHVAYWGPMPPIYVSTVDLGPDERLRYESLVWKGEKVSDPDAFLHSEHYDTKTEAQFGHHDLVAKAETWNPTGAETLDELFNGKPVTP